VIALPPLAAMPDFHTRHPYLSEWLILGHGGGVMALTFAPENGWLLAPLLLMVLLWGWDGATPLQAARRGGVFGLGLFGVGIHWIFISLHDYGNAPAPFAALATFAVVLLMALYPAVTGWLLVRWGPPPGLIRWLLVFPALWTLLDWVRSWLFTGFPWLAVGYGQVDSPLGQIAPYLGVFGVGWAVMLSAGLIWALNKSTRWWPRFALAGLLAALWLGAWGLGKIAWVEPVGPPLRVALIQGNIAQDQKWLPTMLDDTLSRYVQLSLPEQGRSDVIIWPETAIPVFYEDVRPFIAALAAKAREDRVDYVTGIPTGSWESGVFHNSVLSLGSTIAFYHKRRLLVFGEYLPLRGLFEFFRHWVTIPMADFLPGDRDQPLLRAGGQPVGVSICFEAVFGEDLRRDLPEATWLINVSNDAWFKDSAAPHQHLQIARLRALELGRFMARATNTGISAVIDPRGRIVVQGPQFKAEVIRGTVQPLRGLTPYARFGDLPTVGLMVVLLIGGLWLARRDPAAS